MNEVVLFENKDFGNIRVLGDHLKPMFVAKDVAKALGYKDIVNAIKQFCKGVAFYHPLSTDGGIQKVRVIYEPDLYRLIFGSNLKSAIKFQNWVFEKVLPKIRQQGYYSSNQKVALQDRRLDLPDTPCRDIVEQQIKKIEMQENGEFVSLISYEIKETFKDGKQSTIQKVYFNMRKRRDI
ncbi:TPA: Bro-N domain-containing protein [Campylobacter fetus subsp. venerealis]|nr:Bro-N domain-containing protein [Campylobacter fetus subsp. venerealis]HDX8126096.1 Bro-N domain-containing protein [Campylobacter fetus subsp. venerealis]HDX8133956.1 Bro-N domain-containing protein [Campylobacter fetus subsp. venerealis]HDX8141287.1 Bro-N domain-containing protein [Campylobacter fetus subsp. venerealis]